MKFVVTVSIREQAVELQRSGRTNFQVREEVQQLLNQAEHLDAVADQKDGLLRQQALQLIDRLERKASENGLKFQGYIDNGEITNFFPTLK